MDFIINVLEQGLIFSITSMGVYITYKILDFPDLSVDGTFPLGASLAAVCLVNNINPIFACIIALIGGSIAGLVTGVLNVKFKISNLLSSILVMIALYSVNLRIMGKSNIPLFNVNSMFNTSVSPIIIILILALSTKILLDLFLKTKMGFILRVTGDNEQLVTSLGVNKNVIKIIGLMFSNALVAFSGAIFSQYQGFADVGMGTGIVVMGLAAVIMGESLLGQLSFVKGSTMALFGAILYKGSIAIALRLGLPATDLKLITAVIVVISLSLSNKKFNLKGKLCLKKGGDRIASNKKSVQSI
ncbi:ABC transporter permease [Haloimpatiens sp. FM7315]|uniref:ABC transporter permease n=1 Tax=Haloimpatiens sp. FM7315 TaxID=3298609 RepID=UPI0035A3CCB7